MWDEGAVPLELRGVAVVRDDATLLDDIDWTVGRGERWVVLGRQRLRQDHAPAGRLPLHPSQPRGGAGARGRAGSDRRAPAPGPHRVGQPGLRRAPAPGADRRGGRDDRPLRRAGAVVAHLRRRRPQPGPGPPRALRGGPRRGSGRGHLVLRRAPAGPAGARLLRPARPRAPRRADGRARPGRPGGARRRARPCARETRPVRPPCSSPTTSRRSLSAPPTRCCSGRGASWTPGSIDDVLTADSLSAAFGLPLELERRGDRFSAWGR